MSHDNTKDSSVNKGLEKFMDAAISYLLLLTFPLSAATFNELPDSSPFFRSLNCGRTKMHKNLFAALALNNVCWIIWYTTVPYQPQVLNENPVRVLGQNGDFVGVLSFTSQTCLALR